MPTLIMGPIQPNLVRPNVELCRTDDVTGVGGSVRTDCTASNRNELHMGGPAMVKIWYVSAPPPPAPPGHNFTYVLDVLDDIRAVLEKQGKKTKIDIAGMKSLLSTQLTSTAASVAKLEGDITTATDALTAQFAASEAKQAVVNAAVKEQLNVTLAVQLGAIADRLDAAGIVKGYDARDVAAEIRAVSGRVATLEADVPCVKFDEVRNQAGKRIGCKMRTLRSAVAACTDAATTRIEGEDIECAAARGLCVLSTVQRDCPATCGNCD